jgi:hypothetical protein
MRRIAAGVKTGNHDQGLIFDDKERRVWKAAEQGTSNISKDGGKLPGIIAHSLDQCVNRLTETSA